MYIRDNKLNEKNRTLRSVAWKVCIRPPPLTLIHSYWKYSDEKVFFVLSIIYNKFACLVIHFPLN